MYKITSFILCLLFVAVYSREREVSAETQYFDMSEISSSNSTENQVEEPPMSNQTFLYEGEMYERHCPVDLSDDEEVLVKGSEQGTLICKEGYYRINSDDCVLLQDCPAICSENEVLLNRAHTPNEIPGEGPSYECACKEGFERNENNKCVPINLPCGPNSKRVECGTACPITCTNFLYPRQPCTLPCIPNSCVCYDGFVLNDEGECVPPSKCPGGYSCPSNSEWRMCVNPNPITCDMLTRKQIPDCSKICPAAFTCQCKIGFVHKSANDTTCIPVSDCFAKVTQKKLTYSPISYASKPVHQLQSAEKNQIAEDPKLGPCLFPETR